MEDVELINVANTTCDPYWSSWPSIQERALAENNVVVLVLFPEVGNLFLMLGNMIRALRYLEVAVVFFWAHFEGFANAFRPGDIRWDVDHRPFLRYAHSIGKGAHGPTGLINVGFLDAVALLTESQLGRMVQLLEVPSVDDKSAIGSIKARLPRAEMKYLFNALGRSKRLTTPPVQPCSWNMLLRRSPEMVAALERYNPFVGNPGVYGAWHIRTPDGESETSYHPEKHRHVLRQPPEVVCPAFAAATAEAMLACGHEPDLQVFIATNSRDMKERCSSHYGERGDHPRAVYADTGFETGDVHTGHTEHPREAALAAFVDYMFLLDASFIVRPSSSFSGTVSRMKGFACRKAEVPEADFLEICVPGDCLPSGRLGH